MTDSFKDRSVLTDWLENIPSINPATISFMVVGILDLHILCDSRTVRARERQPEICWGPRISHNVTVTLITHPYEVIIFTLHSLIFILITVKTSQIERLLYSELHIKFFDKV